MGGSVFSLFYNRKWHTFDTIDNKGNALQFQTKIFRAVAGALSFFSMDHCFTCSKGHTVFNLHVGWFTQFNFVPNGKGGSRGFYQS